MARYSTLFAFAAIAVLALATAQSPSPANTDPTASCIIYFEDGTVKDNATKTCWECQKQCVGLTDGQCGSFTWNATTLNNTNGDAAIYQCATFPEEAPLGTCAHYSSANPIYPVGFSAKYCQDCIFGCQNDLLCTKIAWGGSVLSKEEQLTFVCPPKPSPRPVSPAIPPSPSPAAPPSPTPSPTPCTNPYAYISTNPDLSTLKAAVDAAGLKSALDTSTLVATLFAPTNAAFTAAFTTLGITAEQALADTTTLTSILSFHLVPGIAATASQLNNGQTLTTALGDADKITVSIVPPSGPTFTPTATGTPAGVVTADVRACASVIHVINQVLVPPAA